MDILLAVVNTQHMYHKYLPALGEKPDKMRDPFKLNVFPSASMVVKADDHILRVTCDVDDLSGELSRSIIDIVRDRFPEASRCCTATFTRATC